MHARCQSVFLFALSTSSATDRQRTDRPRIDADAAHGPARRQQSRIHTDVHGSESEQSEDPCTSALIRDGPVPRLSVTTSRRLMLERARVGGLDVFGARRGAVAGRAAGRRAGRSTHPWTDSGCCRAPGVLNDRRLAHVAHLRDDVQLAQPVDALVFPRAALRSTPRGARARPARAAASCRSGRATTADRPRARRRTRGARRR